VTNADVSESSNRRGAAEQAALVIMAIELISAHPDGLAAPEGLNTP
jgi:hypothetical protein